MFKDGKVLGLIPARGGSKRLPRKNMLELRGKPLISWAIEAGRQSEFVDTVVVSTGDREIAQHAILEHVDEVIDRPETLSSDEATTIDVIVHSLEWLLDNGQRFDHLILLQPTSPLRTAKEVDQAFRLIQKVGAAGAVSVCRTEHPVEWMGPLSDDGFMDSFFQETNLEARSGELRPSYQVNGAIYIVCLKKFFIEKTLYLKSGMVAYIMDRAKSIDIDYDTDLRLAEYFLTTTLTEE